jgi:hypothetical protein
MRWRWGDTRWQWGEKRPSGVNTRDIRPRVAQVITDYGGKEMWKRCDFNVRLICIFSPRLHVRLWAANNTIVYLWGPAWMRIHMGSLPWPFLILQLRGRNYCIGSFGTMREGVFLSGLSQRRMTNFRCAVNTGGITFQFTLGFLQPTLASSHCLL